MEDLKPYMIEFEEDDKIKPKMNSSDYAIRESN